MASILIVDDTESWREMLADELADVGHRVEEVENAEQALHKITACDGAFDFVLMDQVLMGSGMDGLQATRAIHAKHPDIRTIVMTVYGDGESSRAALAAGAYRYIFRSANIEECVADIRNLIESAEKLVETEQQVKEPFWTEQICKNASMAMGIVDRSYRVLYENEAQRRIGGDASQPGGICWVEWHGALRQKEPCPWCPIRPIFEGQESEARLVALVKQGRLRYWQTDASPVKDKDGHVIAALKWGVEVTEQEETHRAALEAPDVEARLKAALGQIRMWGYARARLYELRPGESSQDSDSLIGRVEIGESLPPISSAQWSVEADWYSGQTLKGQAPRLYRRAEHACAPIEPALADSAITEWLEAPLRTVEDMVVGKITIDNWIRPEEERPDRRGGPRPLRDEHFADLMIVAGYAANAIWEARRHEQTERDLALQLKLRELDAKIASTLDLNQLLTAVVEEAVGLLQSDGGSLLLCDEVNQQIKVAVTYGLDALAGMVFAYGEGLSGKIVETGKSLVVKDYLSWSDHSLQLDAEPFHHQIGAVVGAPILGQENRVLGVLSVFAKPTGRRFGEHDAKLLTSFAERAVIAIQNARLYQEKSALYDASKAITSLGRLDDMLDKIWQATRSAIPAESALLFRWNQEAGELTVGASFGYDKAFLQQQHFTFRPREGYPGWVVATREPLLISDVAARPDFPPKYLEMNKGKSLGSFAGVPLIVRDHLIGVFALTSAARGALRDEHLRLLEALAEQIAIAVEQDRLFEETAQRAEEKAQLATKLERRNQQLAAIGQVTAAMRSEDDPETVLRLALTGVTADAGLGFSRAFYFEVDSNGKNLTGVMAIGALSEVEAQRNWLDSKPYRSLEEYLAAVRTWGREPRGELDRLVRGMKVPVPDEATFNQCLMAGKSFWIPNPDAPPYTQPAPLRILAFAPYAVAPLIAKEKPIGLLIVDNKFLPHSITEEDLGMLETLAAQAAVAYENARLIKTQRETFGDIAHQLFSPVQTIQGFIRLLADRKVEGVDTVQEYHQLIAEATEYLKGMADNLLYLRRIDTGRLEMQPELASVKEIVRSAMDLYRYAAEAKQIRVEADFRHSEQADNIQVDKVKMTGAIQNLIENAIKYSPVGTQVTVTTSDQNTRLCIVVADQGIGIPEDEQTFIFQRHWRGQKSKEAAVDGTGIGLSIAKYIVEMHGGEISVKSELGVGSAFTIELPLR